MARPRIVSLLPSATEIVCALGAAEDLVGISHECDYPPEIRGRPVVTRPRQQPPSGSRAIHDALERQVLDALSVYEVDALALAALAPDLILTQDLCAVCAVSYEDLLAAIPRTIARRATILNLRPERLGDVWEDIARVGRAADRADEAERLQARLSARRDAVRERSSTAQRHPRVLAIEWIDPVMLGGLWMAELVTLAGGEPLGPAAGFKAMTLGRAELARLQPDFVLIKPCGYDLADTRRELELFPRQLPLEAWPCTAKGRMAIADGRAYFNRPGPRLVDSLELLAGLLHPQLFADFAAKYRDACAPLWPEMLAD